MYTVDEAKRCSQRVLINGWCFKNHTQVERVVSIIDGVATNLSGHSQASDDVAQHFGEGATNCRFQFAIETPANSFEIEYTFSDGSTTSISIDLAGTKPVVIPIEHRIHHFHYSGKFRIQNADTILSTHFLFETDDHKKAGEPLEFSNKKEGNDQIIEIKAKIAPSWTSLDLGLLFKTKDEQFSVSSVSTLGFEYDRSSQIVGEFFKWLGNSTQALNVLEIGSRARSGIVRKHQFGASNNYTGMDILPGPNVDLVGDIHKLSQLVEKNSFDAIAGFSVIEHVAMPWKAAIEINKVLKTGGRCLLHTHQTWPVHESPCDFWRYSEDTWRTIFNAATGFRVVEAASGGAATIHPLIQDNKSDEFERALGYTSSTALVEKISDTQLSWDVDLAKVCPELYPE